MADESASLDIKISFLQLMTAAILVAGVGNIFLRDDAFGVPCRAAKLPAPSTRLSPS